MYLFFLLSNKSLNRLRSIQEDADFVKEISSLFPRLPLVGKTTIKKKEKEGLEWEKGTIDRCRYLTYIYVSGEKEPA